MKIISILFVAITALFIPVPAIAQTAVTGDLDFGMTFDNREGDSDVTPTKTITFTRLAPELGIVFGGNNKIAGGVVWIQPIGNEWNGHKVSPTLYYRYEGAQWSGSLGMFPRRQLIEELPDFLWGDSLTYFQRNIRGGLLQYHGHEGFFEAYLDWRQLQTETKREAFNIVIHGQWTPTGRAFFAGAHAMMNHYALTAHATPDEHIVDNFLVNPYIGFDFPYLSQSASLRFRTGPVITIERNRADGGWKTPVGFWLEAEGHAGRFFAKNTLYIGGIQMKSYGEFGGALYQGNPFYSCKFYNRTDLGFKVVRNKWVDLDASLNFNFYRSGMVFYQRIILNADIAGAFRPGKTR